MRHSGSVAKGTALRRSRTWTSPSTSRPRRRRSDERELSRWLDDRLKEAYPNLTRAASCPGPLRHADVHRSRARRRRRPRPLRGRARRHRLPDRQGHRRPRQDERHAAPRVHPSAQGRAPRDFAQVVRLVKWWVQPGEAPDTTRLPLQVLHGRADLRPPRGRRHRLLGLPGGDGGLLRLHRQDRARGADRLHRLLRGLRAPRADRCADRDLRSVNAENNVAARYYGSQTATAIVEAAAGRRRTRSPRRATRRPRAARSSAGRSSSAPPSRADAMSSTHTVTTPSRAPRALHRLEDRGRPAT